MNIKLKLHMPADHRDFSTYWKECLAFLSLSPYKIEGSDINLFIHGKIYKL